MTGYGSYGYGYGHRYGKLDKKRTEIALLTQSSES